MSFTGLGGKARTQTRHQGAVPPLAPLHLNSPCPPSTHLLVLLQGNPGLSPILGLDEEQLVPLMFSRCPSREDEGGQDGSGGTGSRTGVSCLNSALPLTPG